MNNINELIRKNLKAKVPIFNCYILYFLFRKEHIFKVQFLYTFCPDSPLCLSFYSFLWSLLPTDFFLNFLLLLLFIICVPGNLFPILSYWGTFSIDSNLWYQMVNLCQCSNLLISLQVIVTEIFFNVLLRTRIETPYSLSTLMYRFRIHTKL